MPDLPFTQDEYRDRLARTKAEMAARDITVNALVIAEDVLYNDDIAQLQSYFQAEVLVGKAEQIEARGS